MGFVGKTDVAEFPRIAVFGIGGGGGNGVAGLVDRVPPSVELIAANTDAQALHGLAVERRVQLGRTITKGLGAGAWPELGRAAAQEVAGEIDAALDGVDLCFITAGMGGGTGTGAAPVVAELARRREIPTLAVVTRPFEFEGGRRSAQADQGIATLAPWVDALVVVPNQRLLAIDDLNLTFRRAMEASNSVLVDAVCSVADLLVTPAVKQIGFAELINVISGMGRAVIGFGEAAGGDDRADLAVARALESPLIDDEVASAGKLIVSISGGPDLSLMELDAIVAAVADRAAPDVELAWGASISEQLAGVVRVALIAQGRPVQRPALSAPAPEPDVVPAMIDASPAPLWCSVAALPPEEAEAPGDGPVSSASLDGTALLQRFIVDRAEGVAAPIVETLESRAPSIAAEQVRTAEPDDAPLLALLATLPARPSSAETIEVEERDPSPLALPVPEIDELWLGDFDLEDPRRYSLADRIGGLLAHSWRRASGRPMRTAGPAEALTAGAA